MEKYALILIVLTNVFLVFILAILVFIVYRMYKRSGENPLDRITDAPSKDYHPDILLRMNEVEKVKRKREELFCPNHPEEPGEATCAICDHLYCKSCLKSFKSAYFCKEHLPLIMNNEWAEVLTLKTSTHDPEQGVKLYDIKKVIFQRDEIPTYIETHYKINVDHDHIETYLVLFAEKSQVDLLKQKLAVFTGDE